ncbi:MAG: serine hydrolase, partial [Phycisphaerae bacterium]|nr:serine hydrolase [Phycisphaerae bacterium]
RYHVYDHRHSKELVEKITNITFQCARTRTDHGYTMEIRMPWTDLDLTPAIGLTIGVQIYVNDADNAEKDLSVKWFPRGGTHADSTAEYPVRLAEQPSPPALAACSASWHQFRKAQLSITAPARLLGETAEVRSGGDVVGQAVLKDKDGRASAQIALPEDRAYADLDISVAGQAAARATMPDVNQERARALMDEEFRFDPFVFSGPTFPPADFTEPFRGEALLGPYEVRTTFYDRDYNPVTTADQPGRYGALIEFVPADGRTVRRFCTLFRTPDRPAGFDLWDYDMQATLRLPDWMGIRPDVFQAHAQEVSTYIKWTVDYSTRRNPLSASLLLGMYEQSQGLGADLSENTETRDRQWWVGLKRKLYRVDELYNRPLVCPRPIEGTPAPILRSGSAKEAGMNPDAVKKIDAVCREWAADSDQAFAVCIARHGVVFFHRAYGQREGKPMTVTTPSWMASITKLMSGTLLMMFVDQGLVGLDARVDEYLPPFRGIDVPTPLTIRHLYTHTCGLWGHWGDEMHDLEERLAEYYPYLEIGKRYAYNGTGLALGGKVMELISADSLPVLFRKYLLDPLECGNTTVTDASGGARSVPMDMAKIAQLLLNKGAYGEMRFFSEETFRKMLPDRLTKVLGADTTEAVEYGMGTSWFRDEGLGQMTFGHGAASAATLRIDLDNDLIVVMTRDAGGENYGTYHPRFMSAIAEGLVK